MRSRKRYLAGCAGTLADQPDAQSVCAGQVTKVVSRCIPNTDGLPSVQTCAQWYPRDPRSRCNESLQPTARMTPIRTSAPEPNRRCYRSAFGGQNISKAICSGTPRGNVGTIGEISSYFYRPKNKSFRAPVPAARLTLTPPHYSIAKQMSSLRKSYFRITPSTILPQTNRSKFGHPSDLRRNSTRRFTHTSGNMYQKVIAVALS